MIKPTGFFPKGISGFTAPFCPPYLWGRLSHHLWLRSGQLHLSGVHFIEVRFGFFIFDRTYCFINLQMLLKQKSITFFLSTMRLKNMFFAFYATFEKSCFAPVGWSVELVCRSSVVRSMSFDRSARKLPNLIKLMPLGSKWTLLIFRLHDQRSMSKLSAQYLFIPLL